jgi:hypothetical protein
VLKHAHASLLAMKRVLLTAITKQLAIPIVVPMSLSH